MEAEEQPFWWVPVLFYILISYGNFTALQSYLDKHQNFAESDCSKKYSRNSFIRLIANLNYL